MHDRVATGLAPPKRFPCSPEPKQGGKSLQPVEARVAASGCSALVHATRDGLAPAPAPAPAATRERGLAPLRHARRRADARRKADFIASTTRVHVIFKKNEDAFVNHVYTATP